MDRTATSALVHGLFGFLARHEAVRAVSSRIGLVGIEYTV
jgi:hypothetical protein